MVGQRGVAGGGAVAGGVGVLALAGQQATRQAAHRGEVSLEHVAILDQLAGQGASATSHASTPAAIRTSGSSGSSSKSASAGSAAVS